MPVDRPRMRAPVEEKVTSEQIAELRALTHRCRGGLPPCECDIPEYLGDDGKGRDAPLPLLQRLLDEREALLGALTGLKSWITRYVSAGYITSDPPRPIEALATARRVLDKVCSP
jgi:hypothetical protein